MSISKSPPLFVFSDLWTYSVLDRFCPSRRDKNCFETRLKHEKTFWIYLCCNLKLFHQWSWKKISDQFDAPSIKFVRHGVTKTQPIGQKSNSLKLNKRMFGFITKYLSNTGKHHKRRLNTYMQMYRIHLVPSLITDLSRRDKNCKISNLHKISAGNVIEKANMEKEYWNINEFLTILI